MLTPKKTRKIQLQSARLGACHMETPSAGLWRHSRRTNRWTFQNSYTYVLTCVLCLSVCHVRVNGLPCPLNIPGYSLRQAAFVGTMDKFVIRKRREQNGDEAAVADPSFNVNKKADNLPSVPSSKSNTTDGECSIDIHIIRDQDIESRKENVSIAENLQSRDYCKYKREKV